MKTIWTVAVLLSLLVLPWRVPAEDSNPRLIMDVPQLDQLRLRNFRSVTSPLKAKPGGKAPSAVGLSGLRMSGSAEFSVPAWKELLGKVPREGLVVVDLRQESHGLLNDSIPVSWYGKHDWANRGDDPAEVQALESRDLSDLRAAGKAVLWTKDGKTPPVNLTVTSAGTEKALVEGSSVRYVRFAVPDHVKPDDGTVDDFVSMVRALPPGAWLHFHCEAGDGRTTTFMAMTDMLRNARDVSLDDILARQFLLGGLNLRDLRSPSSWQHPLFAARLEFLKSFYEFARAGGATSGTSWSEWNKTQVGKGLPK